MKRFESQSTLLKFNSINSSVRSTVMLSVVTLQERPALLTRISILSCNASAWSKTLPAVSGNRKVAADDGDRLSGPLKFLGPLFELSQIDILQNQIGAKVSKRPWQYLHQCRLPPLSTVRPCRETV